MVQVCPNLCSNLVCIDLEIHPKEFSEILNKLFCIDEYLIKEAPVDSKMGDFYPNLGSNSYVLCSKKPV